MNLRRFLNSAMAALAQPAAVPIVASIWVVVAGWLLYRSVIEVARRPVQLPPEAIHENMALDSASAQAIQVRHQRFNTYTPPSYNSVASLLGR